MFAPKTILVPTDFSDFSDSALKVALDLARQHASEVVLFHVVEVIQQCVADYCIDSTLIEDVQARIMESARALASEQIERVVPSGGPAPRVEIVEGIPSTQILKVQEAQRADLIVIGSHGKTGILSHFGSVADSIVRQAKSMVLVVRKV